MWSKICFSFFILHTCLSILNNDFPDYPLGWLGTEVLVALLILSGILLAEVVLVALAALDEEALLEEDAPVLPPQPASSNKLIAVAATPNAINDLFFIWYPPSTFLPLEWLKSARFIPKRRTKHKYKVKFCCKFRAHKHQNCRKIRGEHLRADGADLSHTVRIQKFYPAKPIFWVGHVAGYLPPE